MVDEGVPEVWGELDVVGVEFIDFFPVVAVGGLPVVEVTDLVDEPMVLLQAEITDWLQTEMCREVRASTRASLLIACTNGETPSRRRESALCSGYTVVFNAPTRT